MATDDLEHMAGYADRLEQRARYVDSFPPNRFHTHIMGLKNSWRLRWISEQSQSGITEILTKPYGECTQCDSEGNNSGLSGKPKIELFDLVHMYYAVEGTLGLPLAEGKHEALMQVKPYAVITACRGHLSRAAEECMFGKFHFLSRYAKGEVMVDVLPDSLIYVHDPDFKPEKEGDLNSGLALVSVPLHEDLRSLAGYLQGAFPVMRQKYLKKG